MSAHPHFTRGLVYSVVPSLFTPADNLGLVLGLGLVRVSSCFRVRIRVKVRVSIMVKVSIRTSRVLVPLLRHPCYFLLRTGYQSMEYTYNTEIFLYGSCS